MINLITGTPGAGKTFLAIKLLVDKYFFWHKKDKAFYRNSDSKKYVIFTNISDFKLEHKNLNKIFIDQKLPFEAFFNPEYQKKLHKKYEHIIYVIDECQQFIPTRFYDKNSILYFDTHRHYGDKIWLITQDFKKISTSINTLVELEYRAVKATFSIFGEFRYNIKSNGQIFKRKTMRKDKRVFDLYKSFEGDNQEKHGNPLKYIILLLIVGFIASGFFFYDMIIPNADEKQKIQDERHKHLRKGKTVFKTDIKNIAPPGEIERDLKKIQAIEIINKVIRKEKLYAFQDPITDKWYFDFENPYKIISVSTKFYIIISLGKYLQIHKDLSHLSLSHR